MLDTKRIVRLVILLFIILTVNTTCVFAGSFRCGSNSLSIGDSSFEVLKSCGEPISKEDMGYTIKDNEREFKIVVWVYGPKNGFYHYITFEGGKIVEIKDIRD